MLPNHAPLMVAERFKVLEALYPGRIDLGIGRAPGTDRATSLALRHRQEMRADDDFLERFQELLCLEDRRVPRGPSVPLDPGHARGRAAAADLAAGLERLQRRARGRGRARLRLRASFRQPRRQRGDGPLPRGLPAVGLARARPRDPDRGGGLRRDEAEAEHLAASTDYGHVRRARGEFGPLVSPEEALAYAWTPEEEVLRRPTGRGCSSAARARSGSGSPRWRRSLGADEIMVMSAIFDLPPRCAPTSSGHGVRAATARLSAEGDPGRDSPSPTRSSCVPIAPAGGAEVGAVAARLEPDASG